MGCNARRTRVVQKRCVVIQQRARLALVITLATEAIPASTSTLTTAAKSSALWPSLVHREGTPFQGLSVKSLDRALHVLFFGKLDETEPSGFARHLIPDDDRGSNLKPGVRHELAEHAIGHTAGKISNE
jgi:hypothetical protein